MTHDELLAKINEASPADKIDAGWQSALRAVVEWTMNLQDTESWQDNAEYNAGYNNAIYEVIEIIKKELK